MGSKSVAKYRVIECHNGKSMIFPQKMPNKIALFTFLWPKLANLIMINRPTKNKAFWKKNPMHFRFKIAVISYILKYSSYEII